MIGSVRNTKMEDRPELLFAKARECGFPIVRITEHTNLDYYPSDDDDYVPDFAGEYLIDTGKFASFGSPLGADYGMLYYVDTIIEDALCGRTQTTTSRKYSFGDTPTDFGDFAPDAEPGERKWLSIDVYVNY